MPDGFEISRLADYLETQFVGRNLEYYVSLPSTMKAAREAARQGAPEGSLVLAEEQTAGLGRLARHWHTPAGGNIALSLVLRPARERLPYLVMLSALAVADAIRQATGLESEIKWPNDVLIDGRKVSGILIENELGDAPFSVIGIGVNVNLKLIDFPEIRDIAASLSDATGAPVDRAGLLKVLLEEIERRYLNLEAPEALFREWRRRLVTLGQTVTVSGAQTTLRGLAEDMTPDGVLLLRTADGDLKQVLAGDISPK